MVAEIIVMIIAILIAAVIEYGLVYAILVMWGIATPMLAFKVLVTAMAVRFMIRAFDSK